MRIRLIDANKIRYKDISDGQVPDGIWYCLLEDIRKQPTVKAIPVEWIEKKMTEHLQNGMSIDDVYVSLHWLLTEWEEENEAD